MLEIILACFVTKSTGKLHGGANTQELLSLHKYTCMEGEGRKIMIIISNRLNTFLSMVSYILELEEGRHVYRKFLALPETGILTSLLWNVSVGSSPASIPIDIFVGIIEF
jgi:hypothetical protein